MEQEECLFLHGNVNLTKGIAEKINAFSFYEEPQEIICMVAFAIDRSFSLCIPFVRIGILLENDKGWNNGLRQIRLIIPLY